MVKLDRSLYDFCRMSKIGFLTNFEDIKIGEVYHIPPTILYDRRDFIVERKNYNSISGQMKNEDGTWNYATLYRTELSMRFLVKKQTINKI